MFITTANSLRMPQPLLDRMEIIRIPGYTEDEKVEIAKSHLLPKQFEAHGLKPSEFAVTDEALGQEIVPDGGPEHPGTTVDELLAIANRVGLEVPKDKGYGHGKLVEELWEHLCADQLDGPVFVRDFPVETSPLTRDHRDKPGVTEKWDLYVRGFELATGYSELVDPVIQRERMLDPQGEQLDPENLDETRAGLLQDLKLVQYDFSIGERYVVDEMWPGAVQRQ